MSEYATIIGFIVGVPLGYLLAIIHLSAIQKPKDVIKPENRSKPPTNPPKHR